MHLIELGRFYWLTGFKTGLAKTEPEPVQDQKTGNRKPKITWFWGKKRGKNPKHTKKLEKKPKPQKKTKNPTKTPQKNCS